MKKLILLSLLFITTNLFSQPSYSISMDKEQNKHRVVHSFKSELNLYVKHHYRGIKLFTGGGAIFAFGGFVYSNSVNYPSSQTYKQNAGGVLMTAGGIISLIGMVYVLEAPIHIKRASVYLDGNGVGIKVKL